jgi:hypothetical protein
VIDAPGIPERKYFPRRLLLALILTGIATCACCALLLAQYRWRLVDAADPRKQLLRSIADALRAHARLRFLNGGNR